VSKLFTRRAALPLRIGLLGAAITLFSVGNELRGTVPTENGITDLLIPAAAWLGALLLMIVSLLPHLHAWMRWLVLAAFLGVMSGYAFVQASLYSPLYWTRTDNEMIGEYAVEVLQAGQNPYTWDYSDATRIFRDRGNRTTQFLDSSTQRRMTYPAFPMLLLSVFDAVGIDQARVMTFVFLCALLVMMFVGALPDFRPLVLLPLFVLKDFVILSMIGAQDVIWSAFLVAMLLSWKRPIWRAVLFGFAVNFRQQPWFVAPFLLLLMWHEGGTRRERFNRMALFTGIAGGMFVAFNLPFFLASPVEWILGAMEPAYARFNVFSQGFASLTQYGLLPLTREYYTVLHLGLYVCLLFIGWRHLHELGQAFWILPALFFWVYYRGLANYWFYWLPPLIMGVVLWRGKAIAPPTQARWQPTALVCSGFGIFMVVLALMPTFRGEVIGLSVSSPIELTQAGDPLVQRLHLRVQNNSPQAFRPRFSVQYEHVTETYPWNIENGPEWLNPGEVAEYVISANGVASKMFAPYRGAQVVVADAGLDYRLRAVATVPSPNEAPDAFWRGGQPVSPERLTVPGDSVTALLDNPTAYYTVLGDDYAAQGDAAAAQRAYERALEYDSENLQAIAGLTQLQVLRDGN
jgi:uncharacterized membrane protein